MPEKRSRVTLAASGAHLFIVFPYPTCNKTFDFCTGLNVMPQSCLLHLRCSTFAPKP